MPKPKTAPSTKLEVRRTIPDLSANPTESPAAGGGLPVHCPTSDLATPPAERTPLLSEVFTTFTLDQLERVLDDYGIVSRKRNEGDSGFLEYNAGPFKVLLLPYGDAPNHNSIQFHAGFRIQPTLEAINQWNQTTRYAKAYLDDEGDAIVHYDIDLDGGATEQTILEAVKLFASLLENFGETVLD
jgi:hypothetical protein